MSVTIASVCVFDNQVYIREVTLSQEPLLFTAVVGYISKAEGGCVPAHTFKLGYV